MQSAAPSAAPSAGESAEQMQARHRREMRELQGRVTSKKKNATKKTRRGVNDECEAMERRLRERQAAEVAEKEKRAVGDDGAQAEDGAHEGNGAQEDDGAKADDGAQAEDGAHDDEGASATPQRQQAKDGAGGGHDDAAAASQQAAPPARKRNRQRERLARRAAEQEAAAQRAGEEAAGMPDRRAAESAHLRRAMRARGLREHEVAPDGHCLFAAVADQLAESGVALPGITGGALADTTTAPAPAYRLVRRAAAAYMVENGDEFGPFLSEELGAYAARVAETAEWGGQLELMALARRFGTEIRVLQQEGREEVVGEEEGRATGRRLWLAYYRHGYGLGEHYNSLRRRKPGEEEEGEGEGEETGTTGTGTTTTKGGGS